MPAVIPALAIASVGLTADGAIAQNKAARNAAGVDEAIANHNAAVDRAQAKQIEIDTRQNIETERANNAIYLSRSAASYTASGVLATTGSPLHVQITNAGRLEQQIQQQFINAGQKETQLYSSASLGIAEGEAQASADRARGTIALIDGGAKLAGMAFQDYESGVFKKASKPSTSGNQLF